MDRQSRYSKTYLNYCLRLAYCIQPVCTYISIMRRHPVTSLAVKGDTLVAGFGNGVVSLYSISGQCKKAEIAAHAKAVSAVVAHPEEDIFATVGYDTILNIFTLPSFSGKDSVNVSALKS